MESFDGAVLICDITGFTQLTEQLSKQGPSGVEQLTKCMNNYFTKVLPRFCPLSSLCMACMHAPDDSIKPIRSPLIDTSFLTQHSNATPLLIYEHYYEALTDSWDWPRAKEPARCIGIACCVACTVSVRLAKRSCKLAIHLTVLCSCSWVSCGIPTHTGKAHLALCRHPCCLATGSCNMTSLIGIHCAKCVVPVSPCFRAG